MKVMHIVTKWMKYTLTGKMENRKAEVLYTDFGLRYGDATYVCSHAFKWMESSSSLGNAEKFRRPEIIKKIVR